MTSTPGSAPLDMPQHMMSASPNLMDASAASAREGLANVYDTSTSSGSDAGGSGAGDGSEAENVFVPSKETGEAVGSELVTSSADGAADGLTNASDQLGYLPWELVPQVGAH